MACLQTRDGRGVAKGETAEEFLDIMTLVEEKVQVLQEGFPEWAESGAEYAFDNAAFHTRANLSSIGVERLVVPPRSPDIMKVIEHSFHPVKAAFRKAFSRKKGVRSVKQAMQLLEQVVQSCVTAAAIRDDCSTITATLQSIIKNGGERADPGLR